MGLWAFWVQMKTGKVRKETFGRNFEIIDEKFGELHKKELGEDTNISKYGYPDMGNNIYSDLLPYKDWIRINNAQRCHENMVHQMPVFYTLAGINALCFPKFAFWTSLSYFAIRVFYTKNYFSFRGYNRATASEQ